ncbi:MAG: response regulator [Candidatus Omnitrophica bacterium]|nr:response regulator [Candidatus Omnitrophota bacterium]
MSEIGKDVISILILEDDEVFARAVALIFEKQNYRVDIAGSGTQALELARHTVYQIIIADIQLPGELDGLETVEKIKNANPDERPIIIMVTGNADLNTPIRAIKIGVDDYVVKPVHLEYFLHTVQRQLRIRSIERQAREYVSRIEEQNKRLSFFFDVGRELTASLNLSEVLRIIVERTVQVLDAERCAILLGDESNEYLYIAAAKGIPAEMQQQVRIKKGALLSGWIFQKGTSLLIDDLAADTRFSQHSEPDLPTHAFIGVPLIFKNKTIGVINVSNKQNKPVFSQEELILLEGIADQSAVAIANARFYRQLQNVYLQIVTLLTSTIEMKDHYTKGHSERVMKYAVSIAQAMGLPYEQVETIRVACELHDLGKVGIHDRVLTKSGKLTEEEWIEMKSHPSKAADILRPLSFLSKEIILIEQHHERFDGTGYPFGFKGEEIPLGARIISVADSFDAMTSNRPYQPVRTTDEALQELERCAGRQFDPDVVQAFTVLIRGNPALVAVS